MKPTKLELLEPWLPTQPWYASTERKPELTKVGGFRLDDPQGEVGIEFMVVTDTSGERPASYHLPLTYRGAPLDGAEQALIGTSEHGVLGRRWVYDGTHDPVLVAGLLALLQGQVEPQAQSLSDTADRSVIVSFTGAGFSPVVESAVVTNGPHGTHLAVETSPEAQPNRTPAGRLTIDVTRALRPDQATSETTTLGVTGVRGYVNVSWRLPDGGESRGAFVVLR
ncbi:maltokinase N-terminal cap-like domain-containing protein [Actinopolymorpha alba]|uniref:maltokinase N-terminal cap-like domain-containing protein n=1 Tax=Actinopolymorpha alba TaxID=533267 RepID=UPI00192B6AFE|nr:1,4-alpha-glucan branching protein [Actinopolymorpha alba]